jgi:hypothetical protein
MMIFHPTSLEPCRGSPDAALLWTCAQPKKDKRFLMQLHLLSAGSLHVYEPFWDHRSDSMPWPELIRLVSNPDNVFVVHQPKATKFDPVRLAFENAILQTGAKAKRERTFYDRRGTAMLRLIELVPPAKDSSK